MNLKISRALLSIVAVAAGVFGCYSCVSVDYSVGADYLATNQQFDTYTTEFFLDDLQLKMADSLSGYSQTRATFGTVRDEDFGLTKRACAITLVPVFDSLDFGQNPVFEDFYFTMERDTVCVVGEDQRYIIQNVNVYELTEPTTNVFDINATLPHSANKVSIGTPIINGSSDSICFHLTKDFGEKYLHMTWDDTKDLETYLEKYPGLYIDTDDPIGMGGRLNMFQIQLDFDSDAYVSGNYAMLSFKSEYDDDEDGVYVQKDTAFFFYLGATGFYAAASLLYYGTKGELPLYALNVAQHNTRDRAGRAGEKFKIEGGGGLKPVVSARELKDKISAAVVEKGGDPAKAVLNRATIILPFEFPDDYKDMDKYPQILSPTCRIKYNVADEDEEAVYAYSYMGLTDASDEDENQGDVNRSLLCYQPDITYHAQSILKLDDDADFSNKDIWFLIMAEEVDRSSDSSSSDEEDYYNNLMYASYYNSMYNGYGYGGYGYSSYGYSSYGYGDYYSNYYNYMLMASMYSGSSSSSESTVTLLDSHRFYNGTFYGNDAPEDKRPKVKVMFSIPQE